VNKGESIKRKIRVIKTVDVDVDIDDNKLEEVLLSFKKNISSKADLEWSLEYIAGMACDKSNTYYEYYIDGVGNVNLSNGHLSEDGMRAVCRDVEFEYEKL